MQTPFLGMHPYSIDQVVQQRESELANLKAMSAPGSVFEEISKITASLSDEEKSKVLNSEEYKSAQSLYETGFFSFLNGKFFGEYLSTKEGRIAGEKLLDVITKLRTEVREEAKIEKERLAKLAKLIDQDPELKKRLEAIK